MLTHNKEELIPPQGRPSLHTGGKWQGAQHHCHNSLEFSARFLFEGSHAAPDTISPMNTNTLTGHEQVALSQSHALCSCVAAGL